MLNAHRRAPALVALLAASTLLLGGGCKNKGKKGDTDSPGDSADAGKGGSKKGGSGGLEDGPGEAGEAEPDSTRGRNRDARDLVYLTVDGERCDATNKRKHQVDVNQDGYADLVTLYGSDAGGEKITCKQADLNFDGRLDAFIHYTPGGDVEREQYDQDFDGRIDMGRYYEQGKLVRDEMDLNQDGFADSWRIYDDGRLVRVETDRDADGRADMFTYYLGKQIDRIGYDINGDGKVDTWDHDAARRARIAQKKRSSIADEPAKDDSAYVDEAPEDEGKKDAKKPAQSPKKSPKKPAKKKSQKPKKSN